MEHTFENAANIYLKHGGSPRYLEPISKYLKDRDVAGITAHDVREMCLVLYPTQANSSRNRGVLGPTKAVLYKAHELGWCNRPYIRAFKQDKPTLHKPVGTIWLSKFMEECDRSKLFRLAALVLFMNQTAARVSEGLNVYGRDVDLIKRKILLTKTKTGANQTAYLTDELVGKIYALKYEPDDRIFGYSERWSVNERIKAVCKRAKIEYRSTHSVGRHSFATNALNLGIGIKTAMDAGRWKSSKVFLETYVHTHDAGRIVAEKFNLQKYQEY